MLLTTQYLEEADQLADRIAVIHRGRIVSEGTADELKDTLGGPVLEVGVASEQRDVATEVLRRLAEAEPTPDRSGTRLRVPAREGARTVAAAVRALNHVGVEPIDLALHKPTLDEVFLALTGEDTGEGSDVGTESALTTRSVHHARRRS